MFPAGNDASLAAKLDQNLSKKYPQSFTRGHSLSNLEFSIQHFVGPVRYTAEGMYAKNKR
jgi:myosin heavy subunit